MPDPGNILPRSSIEGTSGEPSTAPDVGVSCRNPIAIDNDLLDALANVSENACYYGCFIMLLLQKSIFRYQNMSQRVSEIANAGLTLLNSFASGLSTAVFDPLASAWQSLYQLGTGLYGQLEETLSGVSFQDLGLTFVKGTIVRYMGPIMLASAQNLANEMEKELENRRLLFNQSINEVEKLRQAIDHLLGYDWWRILENAINSARNHVGNARMSIARAQAESTSGRWSNTDLGIARTNITAAWYMLSSKEAQEEMEVTGENVHEWRPYSGVTLGSLWSHISSASEDIKKSLDKLKEKYDCILRITSRLKIYQTLLIALQDLINKVYSLDEPGSLVTFDIPATEQALAVLYGRLTAIYNQMGDVIDNDRKAIAPFMVENWRNELWGHLLALNALGELPSLGASVFGTKIALPFQAETYKLSEAGVADLNHIMNEHSPSSEGYVRGFVFSERTTLELLNSFINTMGNVGQILFNHDHWAESVDLLKGQIMGCVRRDSTAVNLLKQFDGYDCEQFGFLVNFLKTSGLDDAYKSLVSGRFTTLMEMTDAAESISTTLSCLSAHISAFGINFDALDSRLATELEQRMTDEQADTEVAVRTALALPAMQFEFMQSLIDKMDAMMAEIEYLQSIASGVCK